jgi:cytochrome c oxidase assembly protein subunit 15
LTNFFSLQGLIMNTSTFSEQTAAIPWLHRYILLLACVTVILLAAGALVTGNNAGLAVPDWPLSFGQWMPPMMGGVFFEHGHRMIAATVGFLTVLLTIWVLWQEKRKLVRSLAGLAMATVIMQGILGGATVLLKLPAAISIAHACLAQTLFCLLIALAWVSSSRWDTLQPERAPDPVPSWLKYLSLALVAGTFLQLILGAALRHSILGPGREYFLLGISLHIVGAFLVLGLIIACYAVVRNQGPRLPLFSRLGRGLLVHALLQLFLGLGSYMARMLDRTLISPDAPAPALSVVVITTLHLVVGAIILAGALSLALLSHRYSVGDKSASLDIPLPHQVTL